MRRVAMLVLGAVLLAACGEAATPTPTLPALTPAPTPAPTPEGQTPGPSLPPPPTPEPHASASPTPVPPTPPPTMGMEPGQVAKVTYDNGMQGEVAVLSTQRRVSCGALKPGRGKVFVTASVRYVAVTGSLTYAPLQWTLMDSTDSRTIPIDAAACAKGPLRRGTLHEGERVTGTLVFEAATDATDLELLFSIPTGEAWSWSLGS